jgi:hypothetical protein
VHVFAARVRLQHTTNVWCMGTATCVLPVTGSHTHRGCFIKGAGALRSKLTRGVMAWGPRAAPVLGCCHTVGKAGSAEPGCCCGVSCHFRGAVPGVAASCVKV